MTEPSVEEIVAKFERKAPGYSGNAQINALIASWRERGEALKEAEAVFSIVMPRSNAAEYRRVLGVVRAAIKDKP